MPTLDPTECRRRFAAAARAVLATRGPEGRLDLVPVTFALVDDVVVSAVDHKPKTTRRLQRLANVEADPAVTLLVDHYEADWDRLWWVRAHGRATVRELDGRADDATLDRALARLAARYPAYARQPPAGPFLLVTVARWTGWAATAPTDAPSGPAGPWVP